MKVRTVAELNDRLSDALAWRKRELATLNSQLSIVRREHERATLRRAALAILYAHWEGFTREAASHYLELVSRQRLTYGELQTCFVTLACRRTINEVAQSLKTSIRVQLVDFLLLNQSEIARIPREVVDTRSNLNSETLRDILFSLGLPVAPELAAKELLIDGSLVANRHAITHGKRIDIDEGTYSEARELVLFLLDHLKTVVENAAILRSYRRTA